MARFFIDRPVFAMVISIFFCLLGVLSLRSLPVAQYPQISLPTVRVTGVYPGASADVAEASVAASLEKEINGAQGMLYMSSLSSSDGMSVIDVTFGMDRPVDLAAVEVQNRVSVAQSNLPQDVLENGITVKKQSPDVLMYICLYSPGGTLDSLFLDNYASVNIIDALGRVKGVGSVSMFGSEFGMRVWLRPDKMAGLGITADDVLSAVKEQNVLAPAGQIGQSPAPPSQAFQYTVRVKGRLVEAEEFADIIIRSQPDGSFVRLRDIARIELGAKDYNAVSTFNGRPSNIISVYTSPGANAIETAGLAQQELERLAARFPPDLSHKILVDTTDFVKASLEEVLSTFLEAMGLVLLVVFIFLQSWRATLVPMLAVPVSLLGTFAAFQVLGFSVNTLTMFGMVLAIGIVVDDAIVVVEAVELHMHQGGLGPKEATYKAMEEVSGPVVAIALILAAVFVPVAFLGGITGKLYQQFAVTVAVSVLLSAFVALSLTPALCAMLLKPAAHGASSGPLARFFHAFNDAFDRITRRYTEGVRRCVKRSVLVLLTLGVLVLATAGLLKILPTGFVPDEDQGYFFCAIELPPAAALGRTVAVAAKVDEIIRALPGVEDIITVSGYNILTGSQSSNNALVVVKLKPWGQRKDPTQSLPAVLDAARRATQGVMEATVFAVSPPPLPGLGSTGGFSLMLEDRGGGTPEELAAMAGRFVQAARRRPEIGMIYSNFKANVPSVRLVVDREKAKKLGVPVSGVFNSLQTFLGGLNINDFNRFGKTYKVTMQAEPSYRSDVESFRDLYVRSSGGSMVPLSTLITAKPDSGATAIKRYNLYRTAEIGGGAAQGYSSGQAIRALEEVAAKELPRTYAYEWSGISAQEIESGGQAPMIFALAAVFVFMFLAALYESWSVPFAVILAVPLGVFGAMGAQWLRGLENNVYAQIGLVTLIGLAAKNAILIVEFAKVRREHGMDLAEAAVEASRIRLRPILMTSFAFILGVVPLVVASGAGAGSRHALGTSVFGGMTAATALAIFLVPVLFVVIERLAERRRRERAAPQAGATGKGARP